MTAAIVRLKVTLNDAEPKVLRRVEVLADIKLDRLHLPLQAALGWTNSHLYEIRAKDLRFGLPNPDWPGGLLDARKARLTDVLENAGTKTLYLPLCFLGRTPSRFRQPGASAHQLLATELLLCLVTFVFHFRSGVAVDT
jgi:hypothetical protein